LSNAATPHDSIVSHLDEWALVVERALQLPEPATSWWDRPGVSPRAERWLEAISSIVLGIVAIAWIWTIIDARSGGVTSISNGGLDDGATPTTRSVAAALTTADAPSAAYLTDAALTAFTPLRGASGKVQVVLRAPGESVGTALPTGAELAIGADTTRAVTTAPARPGIWDLAVRAAGAVRPVADLRVVTLTPLSERRGGKIGLYYIGSWPTEGRARAKSGVTARGDYSAPRGLIEVTPQNQDTPLSEHLRLRDFLTHNQANVWPKYVVVQPRLIDKDELVLSDLATRGIASGIHVMSGFRTPSYNAGGGSTAGRANLSRHMYGDANDIWIDNDGDGRMDDLNRDGRIDIRDAQVICDAVDRVERAHPELVGGCGVYPANSAHGPFTHIDARGYRARWTGTGDGG
jgi:uncharacterized protein YcbK (DUF882 family)